MKPTNVTVHQRQPLPGTNALFASAATLAALLLAVAPAFGQNNSLLGARQRSPSPAHPAATSQPAGTPPARPAYSDGKGGNATRATLKTEPAQLRTNALLLRSSPFAVAPPEPEVVKVNDQVTIIIRESKTATTNAKLESKKDWQLDSALTKWLSWSNQHGIVPAKFEEGQPAAALTWQNDYKGDGTYDRKDELTTRIQAKVIDVKPNGVLVLEARKTIDIDEDGYTITLVGECRAKDLTPQNSVLSTQIADLTVDVKHKGAVRDATRRGWFMRGLDFLRLF